MPPKTSPQHAMTPEDNCIDDFFEKLPGRVRILLKCIKPGNYVTTEDDGEDEQSREEYVRVKNEVSFVNSLFTSGGVTSLLYLFGRVIEVSNDEAIHSDALQLVLSVVNFIPEVRESFLAMDGYSMVNQTILSSRCILSKGLFETYLDHCVSYSSVEVDEGSQAPHDNVTSFSSKSCEDIILEKESKKEVEVKHGFIRNSLAFLHLFRLWKKWHKDHDIASHLYSVLLSLLSNSNFFHQENLIQFRCVSFLKEITFMLHSSLFEHQDHQSNCSSSAEEDDFVPPRNTNYAHYTSVVSCLNKRDVSTLCKIVRILVGTPVPILSEITQLVHCLTLLHDSNKAYVCQSKQMMFSLLPQEIMDNVSSKEQHHAPPQYLEHHPKSQMIGKATTANGTSKTRLLRHHNESVSSIDDWLMIKTNNEVATESVHAIIFANLIDTLTQVICDVSLACLPEILGPVLSVDHFIIWSNNENGLIRESVLRCLMTTLKKQQMQTQTNTHGCSTTVPLSNNTSSSTSSTSNSKGFVSFTSDFLDKNAFFLLANQMTQYKVFPEFISVIFSFILDTLNVIPSNIGTHNGCNGSNSETLTQNGYSEDPRRKSASFLTESKVNQMLCLDEEWTSFSRNWLKITAVQASAFSLLFSLSVKSVENVFLCHWILHNLSKLLKSIPSSSHILKYLFDNGIMQCLVNILHNFHECRNTNSRRVNGSSLAAGNNNHHIHVTLSSGLDLEDDIIEKDVYSILEVLSSKLINSTGNVFQEAFDRTLDLFLMLYLSYPTNPVTSLSQVVRHKNWTMTPTQSSPSFTFPSVVVDEFGDPPGMSITDKKSSLRGAVIHLLRSAFDDIERYSSLESARLLLSQSSFRGERMFSSKEN
jgi:hypothetical protein